MKREAVNFKKRQGGVYGGLRGRKGRVKYNFIIISKIKEAIKINLEIRRNEL